MQISEIEDLTWLQRNAAAANCSIHAMTTTLHCVHGKYSHSLTKHKIRLNELKGSCKLCNQQKKENNVKPCKVRPKVK